MDKSIGCIVHTIAGAILIKQDFDTVQRMMEDDNLKFIILDKLTKKNHLDVPHYERICIAIDHISSVEER